MIQMEFRFPFNKIMFLKVHPGIIAVLAVAAAVYGLRWFQRVNLYFPDSGIVAYPSALGLNYEDVSVTTKDRKIVRGWYIAAVRPEAPVILFAHGNGGNISHRLDKAAMMHSLGAGVLIFDYRGYGKSEGSPSERGTYMDAESFYDWLVARGVKPEKIILYGESLGTAVATEMAIRHKCAGLVLESAFTSVVEMGKRIFPYLPVRFIVTYKYDTLSKIKGINCPLLVFHSRTDEIVPYDMGKRIFEEASEPKKFIEFQGGHNDGYAVSRERYLSGLRDFIGGVK